MSRASLELLIVAGWAAQAINWMWALARSGRRAATPQEWTPELLLRAGVVALVVWAVTGPHGARVPLGDPGALLWGVAFLAGHAVAILGRLRLAGAWGIGTRPRADLDAPVRGGIYRRISHPIYLGISVALIAQLALLQNLPALLLVVAAAVVNPWKIARERRFLRQAGPPAARGPPGPPGPPGHVLLGHVPAFRRDPLAFLLGAVRNWGDVVALRIGRQRAYLIWRPEDVQHVLQNDGRRYSKNVASMGRLSAVLGRGLVTSMGELWRRQRHLVQPAFQPKALGSLGPVVTNAVAALRWRAGSFVDVHREMMRLAFYVVGETLFGTDLRQEAEAVRDALAQIQLQTNDRLDALIPVPQWLPSRRNRDFRRAVATLDRVVTGIIAHRTAAPSPHAGHADLLSALVGSMDERQLRDEIVTLLLAGHENTGNALTWMWYLLARHPEVADRLDEELEGILSGRSPAWDDLPQLPYTRMVVEETLRLYPTSWLMLRRAEEDDEVSGFKIERGAIILISPYLTHRNPQHWPDPDVFDPERFVESRAATRHRFAYLPFGGGPRKCVGNGFAAAEMQLVLAAVSQRFRLELEPGTAPVPLPMISLPPRDGLKLRVRDSSVVTR